MKGLKRSGKADWVAEQGSFALAKKIADQYDGEFILKAKSRPRKHSMKPETHPNYDTMNVNCSCGNSFETRSTLGKDLHVEVCAACHPFYTGKQRVVDTAGRVDKFRRRYSR